MKLLIDADSAIYKAGFANEYREYTLKQNDGRVLGKYSYKEDADISRITRGLSLEHVTITKQKHLKGGLSHSISNLKSVIARMRTPAHSQHQMYIGGEGNFRYEIYPEYKANRVGAERPIHMNELREYLIKHQGAIVVDGEEADDRVSWEQCTSSSPTCIVSIDKDLLNTPGKHYNFDTDTETTISEARATFNFATQMLTGDPVDNVRGVKGIGKVGASKILPHPTDDWERVVLGVYEKEYGNTARQQMLMNGRCLWLRREPNQLWGKTYE